MEIVVSIESGGRQATAIEFGIKAFPAWVSLSCGITFESDGGEGTPLFCLFAMKYTASPTARNQQIDATDAMASLFEALLCLAPFAKGN